ncbi:hypothetical protein CB1_000148003 [Camelus ferus]|nr:hypothetical protein CB1_000148003 [Camelus ferus]
MTCSLQKLFAVEEEFEDELTLESKRQVIGGFEGPEQDEFDEVLASMELEGPNMELELGVSREATWQREDSTLAKKARVADLSRSCQKGPMPATHITGVVSAQGPSSLPGPSSSSADASSHQPPNGLVRLVTAASRTPQQPTHPTTCAKTRRFPGPAGLLPHQHSGKNLDDIMVSTPQTPTHGALAKFQTEIVTSSQASVEEDFGRGPWLTMKSALGLDERDPTCFLYTYSIIMVLRKAALKQLPRNKVPTMAVMIKSLTRSTMDASVVFKDPTGEMQGTVHRLLLETRQNELKPGSVLLLKQIGVFSPSLRNHYLNVTPNNLVHIYSPDPGDGNFLKPSQPFPKDPGSFHDSLQHETAKPGKGLRTAQNPEAGASPEKELPEAGSELPGACSHLALSPPVTLGSLWVHVWAEVKAAGRPRRSCRDPAVHNALFSGDLQQIQALFQDEDAANMIVETVSNQLAWSAEQGFWVLTPKAKHTAPLTIAAARGYTDCARYLIRQGAELDARVGGRAALHEACARAQSDCVRLLLTFGAKVNVLSEEGTTPLHLCTAPESLQCAKMLLEAGATVNLAAGESEVTPLHVAAVHGLEEHVALYLEHGADVNLRTSQGETALNAARRQHQATARRLLEAGADARAAGRKRHTPLHNACANGCGGLAELLLLHGASAAVPNEAGHTPMDLALQAVQDAPSWEPEVLFAALLDYGAQPVRPEMLRHCANFPRALEVLLNAYPCVPSCDTWVEAVFPELWQEHEAFYSSALRMVNQPRRLQHLARLAVRAQLGSRCRQAATCLPLPLVLKDYLLLRVEGRIQ